MRPKRWIAVGLGVAGVLLVGGAAGVYVLTRPMALDEPPLPVPNGYDDLLEAAKLIRGPVPDLQKASPEELRAFVERNADVLERARIGLERDSRVPLVESPQYINAAGNRSQAMRNLARLLIAEGRVIEAAGEPPSKAAASYADSVRLGAKISPGGLLTEVLTGYACEALGVRPLRRLVPELSKQDCQKLLQALEPIESSRESRDALARREWALFQNTASVGMRVSTSLSPAVRQLAEKSYDQADAARRKADARLRLLRTRLALRMYQLDHGSHPERLSQLVPDYLAAVPLDPFSGEPLVYGPTAGGYDLSSTGDEADESAAQ
jgi:hypothetical protein